MKRIDEEELIRVSHSLLNDYNVYFSAKEYKLLAKEIQDTIRNTDDKDYHYGWYNTIVTKVVDKYLNDNC